MPSAVRRYQRVCVDVTLVEITKFDVVVFDQAKLFYEIGNLSNSNY